MTQERDQELVDHAVAWHLRLRDGGDADWAAFVEWLEGDPARSEAYDQVEAAHAGMAAEAFPPAPRAAANDTLPLAGWSRRRWLGTAFAAVAGFSIVTVALPRFASSRYEVETAAGERRQVAIADGSMATLNGGTRLILDRNDPRYAELVSGEATFDVQHDEGHPFTVVSGEHRIKDAGTSFNLIHDGGEFAVEVIEGAVVYNPQHDSVLLSAGQTLHKSGSGDPVVARADPGKIAGWRHGQLHYSGAPMRRVARALSRTLGVKVSVAPAVAAQPFTGSLRIERDHAATMRAVAAATGLSARREGHGWVLEPPAPAPR